MQRRGLRQLIDPPASTDRELLEPPGRVIPVGSAVTGLMVWRDLDYTVDAPGVAVPAEWDASPAAPSLPVAQLFGVGGYDICTAVLEHGVRMPAELEAYLARRPRPAPG